jgi:uncharacterized RDD family membrane protein YckC
MLAQPAAAEPRPAGWWERVNASLLDQVLLVIAFAVLFLVATVIDSKLLQLLSIGLWLVSLLLYRPLMLALNHGQTVGRRATGVRVINQDGAPIGLGRAFVREDVVKLLFEVTFVIWLLSVIWPWWEPQNRALHDLVVGTRVVYA